MTERPMIVVAGDTKQPLLPAIDRAGQLREVAFALLLTRSRALAVTDLAAAIDASISATTETIDRLAAAGWLDVDDEGRVVGAAGLSLTKGPHSLKFGDGKQFKNWCAYDSLGIAAALTADATVETACGACDRAIRISFVGGFPSGSGPELLWLADGGDDLRRSFCAPTVLLCGPEHAGAWAEAQNGQGRLLNVVEAARLGGIDWAGCAFEAERLG